jgi:hypothetical protein
VPANTDGIDITADNVTLDLNGFSITGPVTCTGTVGRPLPISSCSGAGVGNGVFSSNDSIKLTNGSVVGFAVGIFLSGAGNLVEAVSAKFNISYGMNLLTGTVRNCSAIKNRGAGLVASDAVIEGSVFVGNGKSGVTAGSSTLIGNMFSQNVVGLAAQSDVYGSNAFYLNVTDISDGGSNTSQNNNNCSGGTC